MLEMGIDTNATLLMMAGYGYVVIKNKKGVCKVIEFKGKHLRR